MALTVLDSDWISGNATNLSTVITLCNYSSTLQRPPMVPLAPLQYARAVVEGCQRQYIHCSGTVAVFTCNTNIKLLPFVPTTWNSLPFALHDNSLALNMLKYKLKMHVFWQHQGQMPPSAIVLSAPSPPSDTIWAMMVVWRIRGKIIRTVLCCIL